MEQSACLKCFDMEWSFVGILIGENDSKVTFLHVRITVKLYDSIPSATLSEIYIHIGLLFYSLCTKQKYWRI